MQQLTYKHLGFPIPYLVVGRWGLTPFPRSSGLKFIVGAPLPVPPRTPGKPVSKFFPAAVMSAQIHGLASMCCSKHVKAG